MAAILFIAPSEQLAERAQEIVLERNMDVSIKVSYLEAAKKYVEEGLRNGTKVVISRGGSVYLLRQYFTNVPIIATKLTSGCYINAFEKIRGIQEPIAFFSVPEIQENVRSLCYLMNVDARYYRFSDEESAEEAVKAALRDGCVYGIGGVLTKIYAEKHNLEYVTLENNREDIELALSAAKQLLKSITDGERRRRALKLRLERYETIFNYTHDGIIAIDRQGYVEVVNRQADEMLPLKNKPYEGKKIEEILPETKLPSVLRSGEKEIDELMKVGNTIINTNRVPIIIDDKVEGVVATFRDIESVHTSEQKIRSRLHRKGLASRYRFTDMIGESRAFQRTIRMAKSYAKTNSSILLQGELGSGKEMFAHSIHHASKRSKGPFVTVDCDNYSARALQAELVGYEDGASPFGNKGYQESAFERAHGGTLFLDKVASAPKMIQSLLVRVIESREVRRLGSDHVIPIDVRIIAATRYDLNERVREGEFLGELMYELSVLTLKIPPLRDRGDDWRMLCENRFHFFLGSEYRQYAKEVQTIEKYLQGYTWKGNAHEVSNVVERVCVLLKNGMAVEEIIPALPIDSSSQLINEKVTFDKWNKAAVIEALSSCQFNISKAARMLNCSRSTLYNKMKKYDIKINNMNN